MADYVTLVKNPGRRRRRRHRNPAITAGLTRNLPSASSLVFMMLGATASMAVPQLLKASSWMNVVWSGAAAIGGGVVLKIAGQARGVTDFVGGGALITALKASHILTNGGFGVPPSLSGGTFASALPLPGATSGLQGAPALPASSMGSSGPSRGVNAFRESEFQSPPASTDDSLLI